MIDEAIVLAGGFGTRLREVVSDVPKPMAPVKGRPFLEIVLNRLKNNGISHVVLSVGYLSESIIEHFGEHFSGMDISYAVEEKALGTGGAIKFAFGKIKSHTAFVLNGDTLFDIDLHAFERMHYEKEADLSIALRKVDDLSRYGSVQTDENQRITGFFEKGKKAGGGYINAGIYIVGKKIFDDTGIFYEKFSMEKDIFEKYFNNFGFYGFPFDAYFIDIGIPEDYRRANLEL